MGGAFVWCWWSFCHDDGLFCCSCWGLFSFFVLLFIAYRLRAWFFLAVVQSKISKCLNPIEMKIILFNRLYCNLNIQLCALRDVFLAYFIFYHIISWSLHILIYIMIQAVNRCIYCGITVCKCNSNATFCTQPWCGLAGNIVRLIPPDFSDLNKLFNAKLRFLYINHVWWSIPF